MAAIGFEAAQEGIRPAAQLAVERGGEFVRGDVGEKRRDFAGGRRELLRELRRGRRIACRPRAQPVAHQDGQGCARTQPDRHRAHEMERQRAWREPTRHRHRRAAPAGRAASRRCAAMPATATWRQPFPRRRGGRPSCRPGPDLRRRRSDSPATARHTVWRGSEDPAVPACVTIPAAASHCHPWPRCAVATHGSGSASAVHRCKSCYARHRRPARSLRRQT